jgi:hypothetical protein
MIDIEEIKTRLANMRYNREYNELNLTERLIVDWEVEYELEYANGI